MGTAHTCYIMTLGNTIQVKAASVRTTCCTTPWIGNTQKRPTDGEKQQQRDHTGGRRTFYTDSGVISPLGKVTKGLFNH